MLIEFTPGHQFSVKTLNSNLDYQAYMSERMRQNPSLAY